MQLASPKLPCTDYNQPFLVCRRYFDKTGTGYLRVEDLRRILHNLGHSLPHRAIKALVQGVADPHGGWRGERVYYRYDGQRAQECGGA